MKKILALHTGGTISMVQEAISGEVGLSTTHHPLSETSQYVPEGIELVVEELFNLPSPHITPKEMLQLKERIELAEIEGFDGVVVTHGTDTLEETAYFLQLTLQDTISVVLTGAMRSSNQIGADGLYNYSQAIVTAADDTAKTQGVIVVMNDEIHAAKFVMKTHTTSVDTFRAPTFGPIGILSKNRPIFLKEVREKTILPVISVDGSIPIIKVYAGMDSTLFDLVAKQKVDGLVIEALGAGNLPPATLAGLKRLLDEKVPVALVSRCANGIAEDIYNYTGGGIELREMGVTFVKGLTGPKARLRLLVGLNAKLSAEELTKYMMEI